MALWIDRDELKKGLADFFSANRTDVGKFGNTVNQCFEAYVFSTTVNWYKSRKWSKNSSIPVLEMPSD